MVGEISPDGKYVWNGTEWIPNEVNGNEQIPVTQATNNVFQLNPQGQEGDLDWSPVEEKSTEGGKAKLFAMSVVGLLILSALSWALYAFVIDSMLFPDPYSKDKFFSVVDEQPSEEDVMSGEAGSWICDVELKMEEDGMTIRTEFKMYASEDNARSYSKISAGIFGSTSTDIWIDKYQISWMSEDSESFTAQTVPISGLDSSPANELIANSSGPIEMCFMHHYMAEGMKNDPGLKFSSEKERFPDEDGVRAVNVETKMEIPGEDEEMNIAVYFDDDDNMLGTIISNSTFECIVTSELKSFSKPAWAEVDSSTPMLIDLRDNLIYDANHSSEVISQYNATYPISGNEQRIVIYGSDYDYENDTDIDTIRYEVPLDAAMNGGAALQVVKDSGEEVNCTITFTDEDSDSRISSGDIVTVSCDDDYSPVWGMVLGLADMKGVAKQVNMEVPWISPVFTIIALLGAAMLVSRRE